MNFIGWEAAQETFVTPVAAFQQQQQHPFFFQLLSFSSRHLFGLRKSPFNLRLVGRYPSASGFLSDSGYLAILGQDCHPTGSVVKRMKSPFNLRLVGRYPSASGFLSDSGDLVILGQDCHPTGSVVKRMFVTDGSPPSICVLLGGIHLRLGSLVTVDILLSWGKIVIPLCNRSILFFFGLLSFSSRHSFGLRKSPFNLRLVGRYPSASGFLSDSGDLVILGQDCHPTGSVVKRMFVTDGISLKTHFACFFYEG
ncbi:hypothetical protein BDC45DRAFT_534606 [Circinella umbellata]|nr:hypothetical protein BDC45DRAFT_534606 [Circinella umbellata]